MIENIENRLRETFSPDYLVVTDESHHHLGHPGAVGEGGHFTVVINSRVFNTKSLVESHRLIYQALQKWMGKNIHALKIKIIND